MDKEKIDLPKSVPQKQQKQNPVLNPVSIRNVSTHKIEVALGELVMFLPGEIKEFPHGTILPNIPGLIVL